MAYMEESLDWPLQRVLPILQDRIMTGSRYHGIPTLKSPLDFWIYQEILWDTRPDIIVEIGNYCGGSVLALAHMCDALGSGKIIGVDTDHRNIHPQAQAHPRISLITGDACAVFRSVERALESNPNVMVIEDSLHSYENTLNVLERYATVVGLGKYFVVEDGICHHGLDIGPQPGPYEAIETFAGRNKNFLVDRSREPYCITWNPKGYLKRVA